MSLDSSKSESARLPEKEILSAIREVRFGAVEIVLHDSRVMEIRQTKRVRLEGASPKISNTDLKTGG